MHTGKGRVRELYLDGSLRLDCAPELVPAPGQYLLAHADASDSPLAVPVFFYDSAPNGFQAVSSFHAAWVVGTSLDLRGPLGHGFSVPANARKVVLAAFGDMPFHSHGLVAPALKQGAEIAVVCEVEVRDFPEIVEVQPLRALGEVCQWADYIALDVSRENISQLWEMSGMLEQVKAVNVAQVLVHAPMPCGGLADCGICAITIQRDWKLACKDGPVFPLKDILK